MSPLEATPAPAPPPSRRGTPSAQPAAPTSPATPSRSAPTAFRDLQAAFGGQRGAAAAYNRFLALRARRAAGRLTDWPAGEDDYAA